MSRILLFAMVCFPVFGFAQQLSIPLEEVKKEATEQTPATKTEVTPPEQKKEIERVQVTGSRIRRLDTEGASPVETITRKDIERTGYTSVGDVLRDSTVSAFGGQRESSGADDAGNAYVDLRGMGPQHTLVLLNGQRLPADAEDGAVDLNLIPLAAVERVEILKDGASAIYGSDALGGVVNIITRKDFSGTQVSVAQTTPELTGGKHRDMSLVNGINGSRYNMVNVLQYRDNDMVFSRDRSWTNTQLSPNGPYPVWQTSAPPSNPSAVGPWNLGPGGCPAGMAQTGIGGTNCRYNTALNSSQLPAMQQIGMMSETNVDVSSRVKVTARLSGTEKSAQWVYAPANGTFTGIPAATVGLPPATGPVNIDWRTMQLGNRDNNITTLSYNALLGTKIDLHKDWDLEITGAQNQINMKSVGTSGYALNSAMTTAVSTGMCNPLNAAAPCSLGAAAYQPVTTTESLLSSFNVTATGPLFKMPAGPVSIAIGTSFMFEKFDQGADSQSAVNNVFGGGGGTGGGQRDSQAAYVEFSIPVTKKLELQLAAREDKYSDFGSTLNPKAALLYHPIKSLLLRASAGTGFKAPLMQELYSGDQYGFPWMIDYVACNKAKQLAGGGLPPECFPSQYLVKTSGNPNLKQEKSVSYSAGAVYEPVSDFNISTDFFLTHMSNLVGLNYDELTRAESAYGEGPLQAVGINMVRNAAGVMSSDPGNPSFIPTQNLSTMDISGVDVGGSYRFHKFKVATTQSTMFYYRESQFVGLPSRNILGEQGSPPWRNNTTLSYTQNERHDVSLIALTTAGQQKWVQELGRLNNYTAFALQYSYKNKAIGTISLGVMNLFGTTPPLDDSNRSGQLNTSIYDQIGRQFYTAYSTTF